MEAKSQKKPEPPPWLLSERTRLRILGVVFPVAFFFGTIGYLDFQDSHVPADIPNAMYHAAQLFILHASHFSEPVPWTLELGRWLAACTTILAIITAALYLFQLDLEIFKIRRLKGHTILCGLGEIGTALANNFADKKKLLIIEKNTENENISMLRSEGARILEGNALDPQVLRRAGIFNATVLYANTGDDFDNLRIIRTVNSLVNHASDGNQKIIMAANIDSTNLKTAAREEIYFITDPNCALTRLLGEFKRKAIELINHKEENGQETMAASLKSTKEELLRYDPVTLEKSILPINRVRFFNINELSARHIFRHHPPDRYKPIKKNSDPPIHIVILGYSPIAEELFKLLLQNCHYINNKKTRISIVSTDSDYTQQKISTKCKDIHDLFELQFIKLNPNHLTHRFCNKYRLNATDVIYICSGEDKYQASYSVKAREIFGPEVPVIRWFARDVFSESHKNASDKTYTIEIPGKIAEHQNIIDEKTDRKAMLTHRRWLKRAITDYIEYVEKEINEKKNKPTEESEKSDDSKLIEEPKPTMLPWHMVNEETRDNNRSVVEHNVIKVRATNQAEGIDLFDDLYGAKVDFSFLKDQGMVELLADMEHRRWMATKYYYGWIYKYIRDDKKKEHNNLLDFNQLDLKTQKIDFDQIKELEEVWRLE